MDVVLPTPRGMGTQCPLCGADSRRYLVVSSYDIQSCSGCGHKFTSFDSESDDISEIYDDRYFTDGGAGYTNYIEEGELLRQHGRRYARILARYAKPGPLLDVGSAAGFILAGLCDAGWTGQGLEPNHSMAEFGRTRLGVHIIEGCMESFASADPFDVVTMIQVIAHFVDVEKALSIAAQATRRGGFWLIETWNRESITARLLGRHWHEFSPPSVRHMFSIHGLDAYVKRFGLLPVACGRPTKFVSAKHLKSLLAYKAQESVLSRAALGLANLLSDNGRIQYPAEDLFWRLYRKV